MLLLIFFKTSTIVYAVEEENPEYSVTISMECKQWGHISSLPTDEYIIVDGISHRSGYEWLIEKGDYYVEFEAPEGYSFSHMISSDDVDTSYECDLNCWMGVDGDGWLKIVLIRSPTRYPITFVLPVSAYVLFDGVSYYNGQTGLFIEGTHTAEVVVPVGYQFYYWDSWWGTGNGISFSTSFCENPCYDVSVKGEAEIYVHLKPELYNVSGILVYAETPIRDVQIQLLDNNENVLQTTFSNEIGEYKFSNVQVSQDMYWIHLNTTSEYNDETYGVLVENSDIVQNCNLSKPTEINSDPLASLTFGVTRPPIAPHSVPEEDTDLSELQSQYDILLADYDTLQSNYSQLSSNYNDLLSESNKNTNKIPGFPNIAILLGIFAVLLISFNRETM